MKVKLHFNRVNMQRGEPEVWTAHTYKQCNQANEVVIRHNGVEIGKTVYNPTSEQPRAYVEFHGNVNTIDNVTYIDV
jgi:hypothetical protein